MEEGVSVSAHESDSLILDNQTRPPSPAAAVDSLPELVDDQCSGSPKMLDNAAVSIPGPASGNSDSGEIFIEQETEDGFTYDYLEEEEEDDSKEPLNPELTQGYRILKEIMSDANKSVNWPFMEPVDAAKLGLHDYHERVKKPMWLKRVKEKFEDREYETITEFVRDMRQMLENCYRYNGPDHYISKRGQKLETVMEQKLTLLSREMREKTTIAATSGQPVEEKMITGTRRRKILVPNDSSVLLNQLRYEEQQRKKEERLQQIEDRRRVQEAFIADLDAWEEALFPGDLREEMRAMWEIPQIGLFLFVCGSVLNLGEVMHWELERSFALPRQSSSMQLIMTALLSTPYQRTKLDKKPLMPYSVWEERLRVRVRTWYKVLAETKGNSEKAAAKLGLDEKFFKVLGRTNPLEHQYYHELTFYQRVWVMKSLCDWCLEQQESIREAMEQQPVQELQAYPLGTDGDGNSYIHFPQFCGQDVRVYRQSPFTYPRMDKPKAPAAHSSKSRSRRSPKKKSCASAAKAPTPTPRDSRLRQKPRQVSHKEDQPEDGSSSDGSTSCSSLSSSESESEEPPEKLSSLNIPDSSIDIPNRALRSARLRASLGNKVSRALDHSPNPHSRSSSRSRSRSNTPSKRISNRLSSPALSAPDDGSGDCPKETPGDGDMEDRDNGAGMMVGAEGKEDETVTEVTAMELEASSADTTSAMDHKRPQTNSPHSLTDCAVEDQDMDIDVKPNKDVAIELAPAASDQLVGPDGHRTGQPHGPVAEMMEAADHPHSAEAKLKPDENCLNCENSPDSGSVESKMSCDKNEPSSSLSTADPAVVSGHHISCDSYARDTDSASCKCQGVVVTGKVNDSPLVSDLQPNDTDSSFHPAKSGPNASICGQTRAEALERKHENLMDQSGPDSSPASKPCDQKATNSCVKSEAGADMDSDSSLVVKQEPLIKAELDSLSHCGAVKLESCTDTKPECTGIYHEPSATPDPQLKTDIKPELPENSKYELTPDIKPPAASDVKPEPCMDDAQLELSEGAASKPEDHVKLSSGRPTMNGSSLPDTVLEPPEITAPNLNEFALVGDCVEDLRRLVERFAEPEPVKETTRGNKQKLLRTAQRKRCEVDLHKRLEFLYGELEPWEPKLIAANKRARLKLRKEHDNYCDVPQPKEDLWDSEESASEDSDEESTEDSDVQSSKKPEISTAASRPASQAPVMSNSADSGVEIIEDLSQRGRLRKRRLIPNSEMTGPTKKQMKPESEDKIEPSLPELTRTVTPSILQSSRRPGAVTGIGGGQRLAAADSASAHVAASSLLAGRPPLLLGAGQQPVLLRLPSGQQVQLMAQRPNPSGSSPGVFPHQTPVLAIKDPNGGPPQLLTFVNPLKHQITVGKAPSAVSNKLLQASSTSLIATSNIVTASISKSTLGSNSLPTVVTCAMTSVSSAPVVASNTVSTDSMSPAEQALSVQYYNSSLMPQLPAKERQSMLDQHGVTLNGWLAQQRRQRTQSQAATEEEMASGGSGADSSAAEEECLMSVDSSSTEADTAQLPQTSSAPPQPGEDASPSVGQSTEVSPGSAVAGLPAKLAQLLKKHGANILNGQTLKELLGSQSALLTSPTKPKYAGNITVKSLLEHRAARLKDPAIVNVVHSVEPASTSTAPDVTTSVVCQSSPAASTSAPGGCNEPAVPPPASLNPAGSLSINVMPAIRTPGTSVAKKMRISEERLNSLVQSVVTEAPTTLPTAQFKVESPFGMPLVQSHRPVTMTTSSMKSPISSVPAMDDKAIPEPVSMASSLVSSAAIHPLAPTTVVLPGTGVQRLVLPPAALQALLAQQKARASSQPLLVPQGAVQLPTLAVQGALPPSSGPGAVLQQRQSAGSQLVMVPGATQLQAPIPSLSQLQSNAGTALANVVPVPVMQPSLSGLVSAGPSVVAVTRPAHSLPAPNANSVAVNLAGATAIGGVGASQVLTGTAGSAVAGNTALAQQLIQTLMRNQSSAPGLLLQNMVIQPGQAGVQLVQMPSTLPPGTGSSMAGITAGSTNMVVSNPGTISSAVPVGALDLLSNAALGLTSVPTLAAEPMSTIHTLGRAQTITSTVSPPQVISTRSVSQTPAAALSRTDSPLQANVAAPVLSPVPGSSGDQKGSVHVLQLTGVGGKPLQVQVSAPAGVSLQQLLRSPQLQKKLAALTGISGSKTFKVAAPAAVRTSGDGPQPSASSVLPTVNNVSVNPGLKLTPVTAASQTGHMQAQTLRLPSATLSAGQLTTALTQPVVCPGVLVSGQGPSLVTQASVDPAWVASVQASVASAPISAVIPPQSAAGQPYSTLPFSPAKHVPLAMPAVQLATHAPPSAVQLATHAPPSAVQLATHAPPSAVQLATHAPPSAVQLATHAAPSAVQLATHAAPSAVQLATHAAPCAVQLATHAAPSAVQLATHAAPAAVQLAATPALHAGPAASQATATARGSTRSVQLAIKPTVQSNPRLAPTVQMTPQPTAAVELAASPAPSAAKLAVQSTPSPSPAEQASPTARKLVLYNINGQLMTSQGIPVSVEGGVVKVATETTAEVIAANLAALRQANIIPSPSSTLPRSTLPLSASAGPVTGASGSQSDS